MDGHQVLGMYPKERLKIGHLKHFLYCVFLFVNTFGVPILRFLGITWGHCVTDD